LHPLETPWSFSVRACVKEESQTVKECILRTLENVQWNDLDIFPKILHIPEILIGLEDLALTIQSRLLQPFETPPNYLPTETAKQKKTAE
jgi:hypothetical protein